MITRVALLGLVAWLAIWPVAAAEPDWAAPFRKYVSSRAYLVDVGQQVVRLEKRFAPHCRQDLVGMKRRHLRIIVPPQFIPGLPIPQGGQWYERLEIDRCGKPQLHNVLATGVKGGSPILTLLLPGTSKADGRLQINATPAAFAIAGARVEEDCKTADRNITNTRFKTYLQGSDDAPLAERHWREVWAVRLCGQTVRVQMDFAPDGKGGFTHKANIAK